MRLEAAPPGASHQLREDFLTDMANLPPAGVDAEASFMSAEMAALWAAQHASVAESANGQERGAGEGTGKTASDTARDTLGLVETVQLLASGPMRSADAAKLVDAAPQPLLDMIGSARHLRGVGYVAGYLVPGTCPADLQVYLLTCACSASQVRERRTGCGRHCHAGSL